MKPKVIVLRTAGTNCEYETINVLEQVGAEVKLAHINSLLRKEVLLKDFHALVIPGGFADGDYIAAGKILANRLAFNLKEEINEFIEEKKLILGICNGFQVLVKAGLLPRIENSSEQTLSLIWNNSGHFQDQWVRIRNIGAEHCVWTKGIESIYCPINHAEGKLVATEQALVKLYEKNLIAFKYDENPNGSVDSIAGICDETGRIFGLMPHPEKNTYSFCNPQSTRTELSSEGEGVQLFRNGIEYIKATFF